eukprot:11000852-Heterocapsa_arctica.AAC.1
MSAFLSIFRARVIRRASADNFCAGCTAHEEPPASGRSTIPMFWSKQGLSKEQHPHAHWITVLVNSDA